MNPIIEISRDDLVAIIDDAIAYVTSLAPKDAEALRAVGRNASSVAVGSFELGPGCPVAQAEAALAYTDLMVGASTFANRFDGRVRERFPRVLYPTLVAVVG